MRCCLLSFASQVVERDRTAAIIMNAPDNHNHQSSMVPAHALVASQEFSTAMSLSLTSPWFEVLQLAPSLHARIPQTATPRAHFDFLSGSDIHHFSGHSKFSVQKEGCSIAKATHQFQIKLLLPSPQTTGSLCTLAPASRVTRSPHIWPPETTNSFIAWNTALSI